MTSKNEPLEITLKRVRDYNIVANNEFRFVTIGFGIVKSFKKMESSLFGVHQPYRMKEGRIILIISGELHVSINLIEYSLQTGNLVIMSPGSIVEVLSITPDFDMRVIVVENEFIQYLNKNEIIEYYIGHQQNVSIKLNEKEFEQTNTYFSLIWNTVCEGIFRREVVQSLVTALLFNISYIRKDNISAISTPMSRQEELFHRFIALVNEFSSSERNVPFYADKLCLTPRYLNTLIKQTSKQTVMEWINQSVMMEAKILLKYSDLLVYQISDKLNFPNPSFFCKFFKKMAGITPLEYQRK
ncbi:helix-turn-helix domain-containing protein [uncultured Bacteroides sp.]|uniref:helix-turn-helix domain-containing protein n=1 Tax=uncultured Bacteroides sp. TaxID=162156 RepID=UPI002AA8AA34|nr:helix-turn-helix domain-containing protein [uncultured Bacteroides sp.]